MVWNGGHFRRWRKLRAICLFTGLTSFVSTMGKKRGTNPANSATNIDAESSSTDSSEENLTTQILWENVAAAIHRSAVDYVRRNKVKDLQFSYESDGDLEHIIKKLSPDPQDQELTDLIKSIWLQSLKFQMMKVSDYSLPLPVTVSSSTSTIKTSATESSGVVDTQPLQLETPEFRGKDIIHTSTQQSLEDNGKPGRPKSYSKDGEATRESQQTISSLVTNEQRIRIQSALIRSGSSRGSRRKKIKTPSAVGKATIGEKQLGLEIPNAGDIFNRVITSKYFGRSYKKCGRHKPVPKIGFSRMHSSQYSVYHAIPFMEIEPLIVPSMPTYLESKVAKTALERPKSKSRTKSCRFGTPLPPIKYATSSITRPVDQRPAHHNKNLSYVRPSSSCDQQLETNCAINSGVTSLPDGPMMNLFIN